MKEQFLGEELQLAKEGVDNAIPLILLDDSIRVPHIFIRLHKITVAERSRWSQNDAQIIESKGTVCLMQLSDKGRWLIYD